MLASGHRRHHDLTLLVSALASWKPWTVRGCLPRGTHGKTGMPRPATCAAAVAKSGACTMESRSCGLQCAEVWRCGWSSMDSTVHSYGTNSRPSSVAPVLSSMGRAEACCQVSARRTPGPQREVLVSVRAARRLRHSGRSQRTKLGEPLRMGAPTGVASRPVERTGIPKASKQLLMLRALQARHRRRQVGHEPESH